MKKMVVLAGQTGVGKTKLAYNLAKRINGEIILVDSIQLYKDLNISANKPPKSYLETQKYHNINKFELNDPNINGSLIAEDSRETIKQIWNEGKIPILEGGCGFYLKMILSGSGQKMTQIEEVEYKKSKDIASKIISYDNDFSLTTNRLMKLDQSVPPNSIIVNDNYRLTIRLAEAIMYGNGAYKLLREREQKIREENKLGSNIQIFKFFLFCNRIKLYERLKLRCETMIKNGLLNEISNLLDSQKINSNLFNSNNRSVFLNAYGIHETIKYFTKILELLNEKHEYIKAYGPQVSKKSTHHNSYKKIIDKILYGYLTEFFINNRQYAKKQASWFRSEDILWLNSDIDEQELLNQIENKYLNMHYDEFNKLILSEENLKNKKLIEHYSETKPIFEILENKQFIKKFLEETFAIVELYKNTLKEISETLQKNKETFSFQKENVDIELIKKYLNMSK